MDLKDGVGAGPETAAPQIDVPTSPGRAVLRRVGAAAARLARKASDFVVPPVCVACHAPLLDHDTLCPSCWQQIEFIRPPVCDRLGLPMPFDVGGTMISAAAAADPPVYDRARAVARYDAAMRELIRDLKFHDQQHARRLLGRWLVEAGREILTDAHAVVPVPLSRLRLWLRRYNQSAVIAAEVARRAGIAYRPLALVRTRRTRPQPGLSAREREENVRAAFRVPRSRVPEIAGRNVVLVDDVVTTGATANACARALKSAGAARVDILALALVTDRVPTVR